MNRRTIAQGIALVPIVALLLLCAATISASAPPAPARAGALLVGVQGVCDQLDSLAHIDPQNAQETVIRSIAAPQYRYTCNVAALDTLTGTLYTVRYTLAGTPPTISARKLVAIDTQTGAVTERGPIEGAYITLGFNPTSRTLFALKGLDAGKNNFVLVDPETAQETVLSSIGGMAYGFGVSAADPATGELYIVRVTVATGAYHLIAVNTSTGALSDRGVIAGGLIFLGYNTVTDTLFGVKSISGGANNFVHLNPATAEETALGNVGGTGYGFISDASALDEEAGVFYVIRLRQASGERALLAIDTQTGAEVERGFLGASYSYLGVAQSSSVYLPLVHR